MLRRRQQLLVCRRLRVRERVRATRPEAGWDPLGDAPLSMLAREITERRGSGRREGVEVEPKLEMDSTAPSKRPSRPALCSSLSPPHSRKRALATTQGMAVASPSSSPRRSHSLDLPSLHPLDHSHPLLSPASTSTFDPDAFLLSRLPAPLGDLRDELRSYQAQLKSELVELINLDYREFVELGTGLKGEGKRLEKVRRPLNGIREDVAEVRESLKDSEDKLQDLLHERAELRDEKTLVQLLLSLTDSLSRTETLLSIAPPTAPPAASAMSKPGQPSLSLVIGDASAKVDLSDSSEGQSMAAREKVVGRVAAEYTRVLYLSDKARKEGCALLTEVEWVRSSPHSLIIDQASRRAS